MKKIVFLTLTLLFTLQIDAQEQTIAVLRNQLDVIETEEKNELKKQIEDINSMFENRVINAEEAKRLKIKAAEARAWKIQERQAVILETIAILEKKQSEQEQPVRDPNIFLDIDSYFSGDVEPQQQPLPKRDTLSVVPARVKPQPVIPLKEGEVKSPTTLDLVVAFGFNNAIGEGRWQDLEEDRDYALYNSKFMEIGLVLKTPLTKKNGLRLKYGLSYQSNRLRPNYNRFFAEVDGQTQLRADHRLTASGFHVNNLVLPLHLEFGPTRKKQNRDYTYYSSSNQLKFGIGGYMGINLSAKQWVERPYYYRGFYWIGREEFKGYNINKEIYGLSAYVGIGAFSIYGKYDLNTIFQNAANEQQFVSLGIRLDL
ncbi:hypothetical protein LB467_00065 [Salegentibacter sp. JZCK2]|uniref:hypothetical protein n=1 Tax=Salegentibacter tibetensis TaxID=2873600 RepID=UPI001CCAEA7A|nr:hypothetical protein [Salegentibacter tibetensis]MBZ9728071.1 hypothetical protein [Salegentibacter tibetensis]